MTTDRPDLPGVTRRSLLRAGAAIVAGAGAFAGAAAAHECPRTPGYWANHPWPDTIPDPFEIGGVSMAIADWQAFLVAPTRGDKAAIMAKHLIATVLNFQFRPALPAGDPGCVDEPLSVVGGRTVREVKRAAESWLLASSFDAPESQDSWTVDGIDGEPLKDVLDAFNNDNLGLDCDCDEVDGDDGADDGTDDADSTDAADADGTSATGSGTVAGASGDPEDGSEVGSRSTGPESTGFWRLR